MKIIAKKYGFDVLMPETRYSSEFSYCVRQVFILNGGHKGEPLHSSISGFMDEEKKLTRRLLLRVWSMWGSSPHSARSPRGRGFWLAA